MTSSQSISDTVRLLALFFFCVWIGGIGKFSAIGAVYGFLKGEWIGALILAGVALVLEVLSRAGTRWALR